MTGYCIVLTTTDKAEVADQIAGELVKDELVACVQIDEVKSVYKWEGSVQTDKEFRLVIKTSASKYEAVEKRIGSLHNYKLPQIVKVDISGGSSAYLNWLGGNIVADDKQ
jgi:periplasmic divalent cation tolerance protein